MQPVEIVSVTTRRELQAFIDLPWRIYANDPHWVPPLKRDVKHLLDAHRHPFWEFAEQILFLARQGSEVKGRIAGILDHQHNRHLGQKAGAWGFFECVDDAAVASALLRAVEDWARAKGMDFLRGPLNPSLNYEAGILLDKFTCPPTLLMTHNPSYYPALIESAGFVREKDLLSFWIDKNLKIPEWVMPLAERLQKKGELVIRPGRMPDFKKEMALVHQIYNASWSRNWGFVPPTKKEIMEIGRSFKKILDPKMVFFLYHKDAPVGMGLSLPDWSPVLKRLNGRIGLSGLTKLIRYGRMVSGLRGFMFGIREEYRQMGFPMAAFAYMYQLLKEHPRYQYMELGWLLEDNRAFNEFFYEGGLEAHKHYRIYGKPL